MSKAYGFGFVLFLLAGCTGKEQSVDIKQASRDNIVDVSNQLHTIDTDTLMIGGSNYIYANNDRFFVLDVRPAEEIGFAHVFNAQTLEYDGAFGQYGAAPTEILMPGGMFLNNGEGTVYIQDNAQWKILEYNVSDALKNDQYKPTIKLSFAAAGVPYRGVYVNDTLAICEIVSIKPDDSSSRSIGRFNLATGETSELSPDEKWPDKARQICAVAPDNSFAVEAGYCLDLMKIYNPDGSIKRRITGPGYKEPIESGDADQFTDIAVTNDYILGLYSGSNNYATEKIMVFNHDGEYLATLSLGVDASRMAYSPKLNRLFLSVEDENSQFAYIDFDAVTELL